MGATNKTSMALADGNLSAPFSGNDDPSRILGAYRTTEEETGTEKGEIRNGRPPPPPPISCCKIYNQNEYVLDTKTAYVTMSGSKP